MPSFPRWAETRRNQYASRCASCKLEVPADQGSLTHHYGAWIVTHVGACTQSYATVRGAICSRCQRARSSLSLHAVGATGVPRELWGTCIDEVSCSHTTRTVNSSLSDRAEVVQVSLARDTPENPTTQSEAEHKKEPSAGATPRGRYCDI